MAFKACCSNARCLCSHATEINFLGINYPTSERVPGPPQHDKPDEKPSTRLVKIKPLGACLVGSYECRECERVFVTMDQLDKHMRNHEEHRPHKCPRCRKGFKQPSHLSQHLRTHTDERPFACEVCQKRFKQSCQLKQHMRLHTGEKPYKCPECERGFKQASQLNQHVRLHTGEKPYKCLICTKTFTQASQLRSHKKTHQPKELRKTSKKVRPSVEDPLPSLVHKQDIQPQPQGLRPLLPDRSVYFHT